MKLVYVAGRYRGWSPEATKANIKNAQYHGILLCERGFMPVIPHCNTAGFELLTDAVDQDFWLDGTMELMRRCDYVLMVPGYNQSDGAIQEMIEAERLHLPIFYDARSIPDESD